MEQLPQDHRRTIVSGMTDVSKFVPQLREELVAEDIPTGIGSILHFATFATFCGR